MTAAVALGHVLRQRAEWVNVDDWATYRRCRVQQWGQGAVVRDVVTGAGIRTKTQQVCRAGQLIVAEIDAKVGGFAIVTSDLDGAIASGHYFLFDLDQHRVDPGYLRWYLRTDTFQSQVVARGSTNYAAIRPSDVLNYTLPLPALGQQRAVAASLDALATRVRDLEARATDASALVRRLKISLAHRPDLPTETKLERGWTAMCLGDVIRQTHDVTAVDPLREYPNVGVLSFGRGLFEKPPIAGASTSANSFFRIHAGQFIYSRLFAFEGAYATVSPRFDAFYVSAEFPTFDLDSNRLVPEFLDCYFSSPSTWEKLGTQSTGMGDRRQRVQPSRLLEHELFLPPLVYQRRLPGVLRECESAERLGAAGQALPRRALELAVRRAFDH